LSHEICVDCNEQLTSFVTYKRNLIKAQSDFNEYLKGLLNFEDENISIKTEQSDTSYENCVVVKEEIVDEHVIDVSELPFVAFSSTIVKEENIPEEDELWQEVYRTDKLDEQRQNLKQKLVEEKQKPSLPKVKRNREKICKICNKTLSSSSVLRNHIDIFHSGKEANIPCQSEGCQKLFINNYQLKEHLKIAHKLGDSRSICEDCGASFGCERNLTFHIQRTHLNVRNFACDICGHRLFQKYHLMIHVRLQLRKRRN
jgi:hypothetical protein